MNQLKKKNEGDGGGGEDGVMNRPVGGMMVPVAISTDKSGEENFTLDVALVPGVNEDTSKFGTCSFVKRLNDALIH